MKIFYQIFILCLINAAAVIIEAISVEVPEKSLNEANEKYGQETPEAKSVTETIIVSGHSNRTTESSPTILDYTTTTYLGSDGERTTKISITEVVNPGYTTTNFITIDGKSSSLSSLTPTGVQSFPTSSRQGSAGYSEETITVNGNVETITYSNPSQTTQTYSNSGGSQHSSSGGASRENTATIEASFSFGASGSNTLTPIRDDPYNIVTTSVTSSYGENECHLFEEKNCESSSGYTGTTSSISLTGSYGGIYTLHQTTNSISNSGSTSSHSNSGSHTGSSSIAHTTASGGHSGATSSSGHSGATSSQSNSGSHTGSSSIAHTTASGGHSGATSSQSHSGSISASIVYGGSGDSSGHTSGTSATSSAGENNCHLFEEHSCIESSSSGLDGGSHSTYHTTALSHSGTTSSQSYSGSHTGSSSSIDHTTASSGHSAATSSSGHSGATSSSGHSGATSSSGHSGATPSSGHSGVTSLSEYPGATTSSGHSEGEHDCHLFEEHNCIESSETSETTTSSSGSGSLSIHPTTASHSGTTASHSGTTSSHHNTGSHAGSSSVHSGTATTNGGSSHTGSSSTGPYSSSERDIYEYVELGQHMYFNGSIHTTSVRHLEHIYYRGSSDSLTLIDPNNNCPFSQDKPFIQEAIASVKTVGNSLIYDIPTMNLMLVDQYGGDVLSYNTVTGKVVKLTLIGQDLQAIIPTSVPNEYIVVVDNAIVLLENTFAKDELVMKYKKVLAIFDSVWSLSVGETDSNGRLWIAAMYKHYYQENIIYNHIYMIDNGKAFLREKNNRLVGGMAWSSDDTHFYTCDLLKGIIYDYQVEKLSTEAIFDIKHHPHLKGVPYDVTVDMDGHIWTTLLGGTSVIKINSTNGNIIEIIAAPTHYPTSLTFGDLLDNKLFMSSAYAEHPTLDLAHTYVISNTNSTGTNNSGTINTAKIFGKTTMEIKNPNSIYSREDTSKSDYAIIYSTTNYHLSFKEKEINKCGFLKNNITIQQVPVTVETIGMSLHYDTKDNAIFFADLYKPAVIEYKPNTGENVTLTLEGITSVSSIIPVKKENNQNNQNNQYVVSEDHNLVLFKNNFQNSNNNSSPLKEIIAKITPNDMNIVFSIGKVDVKGRLWIGTKQASRGYTHKSMCNLYLLHKKTLKVMEGNISASGGMAWSTDNKHFYFADSGKGVIYKYMYTSSTAEIKNRTTLFQIKHHHHLRGSISDITVDNEGFIWANLEGGSAVLRINSTHGHIDRVVAIPLKNPSTLTFAGPLRNMLYVSSAKEVGNSIDNIPFTIVISNLGVTAGRIPTDRYVL